MQNIEGTAGTGRKSRSHRGFLWATLLSLTLVCGSGIWWIRLTAIPSISIPTPQMPSPNAYDTFVQAAQTVQDKSKINRGVFYSAGFSPLTLTEKADLVRKNRQVLQEIRAGFRQEYQHPPARSFKALFPHFSTFRTLSRLFTLEGDVYASQGAWGKTIQCDLDAIQFGLTLPRGAGLLGEGVGLGCESIGRKSAWEALEHLNGAEAKAAAQRLEQLLARRYSHTVVMEEAKVFMQAALLEMFRDPKWRTSPQWTQSQGLTQQNQGWKSKAEHLRLLSRLYLYSNGTIFKNYTDHADALIARSRLPFTSQGPIPPAPSDFVNQQLCPTSFDLDARAAIVQAHGSLLLIGLGLRAYYADHQKYPLKLTELVPKYLRRVPDDPCNMERAFSYILDGSVYHLYSLGPDKTDDIGKPIDDPNKTSLYNANLRYTVQPDSRGDIVVGVNK